MEVHGVIPEAYVLEKHGIDSTQFAQSNSYYAHNIEAYQLIMDKVKIKLNAEKKTYDDLLKKEEAAKKKRNDSIKENRKNNPGKLEVQKRKLKVEKTVD